MLIRSLKRICLLWLMLVASGAIPLTFATCQATPDGFYAYAADNFFDDLADYLDELFDSDD